MLESKRRAIIFFVIAILLAVVSGYLILNKVQTLNSDLGSMVEVYVANNDIYSRSLITPDDVTTEEIPNRYLRDEYITELDEFMNTVSVVPLSRGQIITTSMLKEASDVTESGNRLVSILRSERISFDQELEALDRADIIVSQEVNGEKITEVFMEDVKVAQVTQGEFAGVQVEIPFDQVTDLIHMQNYAERIRIIRANVGQTRNMEPPVDEMTDEGMEDIELQEEEDEEE